MSEDNKKQILKVWPDAASKVYTIKEFFGKNGDIANPFIADDPSSDAALTRYRRCYRELYALLSAKGNIDKLYDAVIK